MSKDKDDRKRPPLRLVVSNPEKRGNRKEKEEEVFVPLPELVANREMLRPDFYRGMDRRYAKIYSKVEAFLGENDWPCGLDPHHGRVLVMPATALCPAAADIAGAQQDELLLFVTEDVTEDGLCLSLETILPFWSDDEAVMEDALLFAPVHQYGSLFLEENSHDGLLDLVYRLAMPLYPPALTRRILKRFFTTAAVELSDTLQSLAGE